MHSPTEYLLIDSLTERAKLAALLLMKLASGEIPWPPNVEYGSDSP
jgi:glutamate carboxypeptidase